MEATGSIASPYAELLARLDSAESRTLAIVDRLHHAARRRRPAPDKWCVDEILDHLATTTGSYSERVGKAISKARLLGPRATTGFRHTLMGNWLLSALKPEGKAMSAPGVFRPRRSPAGESASHDALGNFKAGNVALRGWIRDASVLDGSRVKVSSPALALIRLNLDDVVVSQVMHLERHLGQIERTVKSLG